MSLESSSLRRTCLEILLENAPSSTCLGYLKRSQEFTEKETQIDHCELVRRFVEAALAVAHNATRNAEARTPRSLPMT